MKPSSIRVPSAARRAMVAVLLILLAVIWAQRITGSAVEDDAAQATVMGATLWHTGVMSSDVTAPFKPSMYREPVPVAATAITIGIIEAFRGEAPPRAYLSGDLARAVKLQNIVWLSIATLCAYWACTLLSGYWVLGFVCAAIVGLRLRDYADTLYSEPVALALMLVGCTLLLKACRDSHLRWMVFSGLVFALLALTKAVMLYVFVGVGGVLVLSLLMQRWFLIAYGATGVAVAVLAFAIGVAPWMLRNHANFGAMRIAERGGVVLLMRAVKNTMTPEEYRGAFYVWAPARLQPLVGRALGFAAQDLSEGGRLQRLNREPSDFAAKDLEAEHAGRPEETMTYYRRARAERVKLTNELRAAGDPQPESAADQELERRAMNMIKDAPGRHLALTVPFLWRGAFLEFPILMAGLAYAVIRRRADIALYVLPALGLILFYGLFSHFIQRYAVPAQPVAVVVALVLAGGAFDWFRSRAAGRAGFPRPAR
jgi:hypothetical protein